MTDAVDRACEHLDRISGSDASRVVIMDLLDEVSALKGRIERAEKCRHDVSRPVLTEVGMCRQCTTCGYQDFT